MLTASLNMSKPQHNPSLTAFRERHKEHGAVFHTFQGGEAVRTYAGQSQSEREAALEKAALLELPTRESLAIKGRNAARLLHLVLAQDVQSMSDGESCRSSVLDRHGKLFLVITIWRKGRDEFLLLCPKGMAAILSQHLKFHEVGERLEHSATHTEFTSFFFFGERIAPMLGLSDHRQRAELHELGSVDAWSIPHTAIGTPIREIIAPLLSTSTLISELQRRGATLVGTELYNGLRIEAGFPLWGVDGSTEDFPNEAGFTNTINYSKGCFLGQEIVNRIFQVGPRSKLMGIRFLNNNPPQPGQALVLEDGPVIEVSSVEWCPNEKLFGGLAIVPSPIADPGRPLTVLGAPNEEIGTLCELPFSSQT